MVQFREKVPSRVHAGSLKVFQDTSQSQAGESDETYKIGIPVCIFSMRDSYFQVHAYA